MIAAEISNDNLPGMPAEREKLHTSLIYGVANDLRTPLASIIGSLEIYRRLKPKLSEERGDTLLATAVEEARRLDNFVSNILDIANIEKDRMQVRSQPSNPLQLVWATIKRMESQLTQHDVQVHAPQGSAIIEIDPTLFMRAFTILLDNAAKYTPPQTPILVTVKSTEQELQVEVRDCGPGIPEEHLGEIFDKYTRLKTDRQIAGTGLGLPIARAIARLHNGNIDVKNHPMGGTVFTLTMHQLQSAHAENQNQATA